MSTKCGVGYSEQANSYEAAVAAAKEALEKAGVEKPSMVLFYTTSKHNPEQTAAGIRSVIGTEAKLIGGSSVGVITNDKLGYEGYQTGVAVLYNPQMDVDTFVQGELNLDEYTAGAELAKQIQSKAYAGDPQVLLMYDSIKIAGKELNLATPMIAGMKSQMASWPSIAGVGVFADMQWTEPFLWRDDEKFTQAALALVLSNKVRMDQVIIHGCVPVGDYHTITKTDGNVVLEIDGQPATDAIAQMLGAGSDKTWEDYPLFVTLGVNRGDKWDDYDPKMYTNRLTLSVDKERKGLVMFENDLQAGMEFQLMRRDVEDFSYMRSVVEEFMAEVKKEAKPFFALYIDCAGRASRYCGSDQEEAAELQAILGDSIPLLGMFSGVELAVVQDELRPLDWTGVLCVFSDVS